MINIYGALIKAQNELKNTYKDTEGHGYKYTELSTLLDFVKPILQKHGLVIIQTLSDKDDKICVTTKLAHESGEIINDTICLPLATIGKNNNVVQQAGATITYARRYSISAMLNIASEDDTDARQELPTTKTIQQPKAPVNKVQQPIVIKKKGNLAGLKQALNKVETQKDLDEINKNIEERTWTKEDEDEILYIIEGITNKLNEGDK